MPLKNRIQYVLLNILLLLACEDRDDAGFPCTIEMPTFTIETPPGWRLFPEQGYDSNVGKISGPQGTIYFDQGFFSPGFDNVTENDRTIYFRRTVINSMPAIIHKERLSINDDKKKVMLTVYIDGGNGVRNRLYVFNPAPLIETVLIKIMKTHRFK